MNSWVDSQPWIGIIRQDSQTPQLMTRFVSRTVRTSLVRESQYIIKHSQTQFVFIIEPTVMHKMVLPTFVLQSRRQTKNDVPVCVVPSLYSAKQYAFPKPVDSRSDKHSPVLSLCVDGQRRSITLSCSNEKGVTVFRRYPHYSANY